ncbi:LysR family transcriptional regulator [Ferrimonas balearica]|uniref:LysR family transcriptional regulator n=1 Tax=Ferrimonas balearica TaxID=44012 RepID=UPI001C98F8EE|nr:LysR family transcriptional regulator [Ferrimonas balearica]MBY5993991.1 LysR family transcriptional regulator [Ferrimonas balearica]
MKRLEAIEVFCQVVELGQFSAVARQQNLSTAMVSKHITQLEAHLGVRLFHRTTRQVTVTEVGQRYYDEVRGLLRQLAQADQNAAQQGQFPTGRLTVSASLEFGSQYLASMMAGYQRRYPQVQVDLSLTNRTVDLIADRVDLAIRVAPFLPDSRLIATAIAHTHLGTWASPEYLAQMGTPARPEALAQHRCLLFTETPRGEQWLFQHQGEVRKQRLQWHLASNNGRVLNDMAAMGEGIVQAPDYSVAEYVRQGRLVEVLAPWRIPPIAISAIYPQTAAQHPKVRTFVEALKAHFARPRW